MFTATKRTDSINLKEVKKRINKYYISENYYNSDINFLESGSETEELKKVIDSEESDKFIEKSDIEELFNQEEA